MIRWLPEDSESRRVINEVLISEASKPVTAVKHLVTVVGCRGPGNVFSLLPPNVCLIAQIGFNALCVKSTVVCTRFGSGFDPQFWQSLSEGGGFSSHSPKTHSQVN